MNYCRTLVREQDYNRYLLSFFIPRIRRDDVITILAFHCELQSILTKTTERPAALLRLKWWADQIESLYTGGTVTASPVIDGLKNAIASHKIEHALFEDLIHCYEIILQGTPTDPDEFLYHLCASCLNTEKEKNRFSKVLQHHDQLSEDTPFRALRLWLGI